MPDTLSTAQVATASGYSVQQVRDLERVGALPPVQRSLNGYRRFGEQHLVALRCYRMLATAVGPVRAREVLRETLHSPADRALAVVSGLHVGLSRARESALEALHALDSIQAETRFEAPPRDGDAMSITELAAALGVRPSTLRFWEGEGLLAPERIAPTGARRYPLPVVRVARIVAALRAAGNGVPEVRRVVHSIRETNSDAPRRILQARLDRLGTRMRALLEAGPLVVELLDHR